MLQRLFAPSFSWQFKKKQRLLHLLFLAGTLTASNIFAYAIAASLFLTKVGSQSIPIFYICLGLLSIPISGALSQIIDSYSRLKVFRYLLIISGVVAVVLWSLLSLNSATVYYAIYVSSSILDLLFYIILWTLISDYFTPLELERLTALIAVAMTTGGTLGGTGVRWLSEYISTENLLLFIPILYAIAIGQIFFFESSEKESLPITHEEDTRLIDSVKNLAELISRYPIIILLAINTLVAVLLWAIGELEFFNIYSKTFTEEEEMTGFLGLLSAGFSILDLIITYFFTRPMIQVWGVSRMNLVYPITTLISFSLLFLVQMPGLAAFRFPVAIFANINYDPFSNGISSIVQNLNYNAIPHKFVGRVRVIIDGLLYPTCQAIAGVLLLFPPVRDSTTKLAAIGIILSTIFIILGYAIGKSYLRSLLWQLRLGTVNLDDVSEGLTKLPRHYADEVRQLLRSEDSQSQLLGLELAARLAFSSQLLDEVPDLLLRAEPAVGYAAVKLLTTSNRPEFNHFLRTQLAADSDNLRAVVLEALIASDQLLSNSQLCFFLEDPHPKIRALACAATWQALPAMKVREKSSQLSEKKLLSLNLPLEQLSPEVQTAYRKIWTSGIDSSFQLEIIRVVNRMGKHQLVPLILATLQEPSFLGDENSPSAVAVKREGLSALTALATPEDEFLAPLVVEQFQHPDPLVRTAALELSIVLQQSELLELAITGLTDAHQLVRQQAVKAIAAGGDRSLTLLQPLLTSSPKKLANSVIMAIGQMRSRSGEEMLFQYLKEERQMLLYSILWRQQIPLDAPECLFLALALQDYQQRYLQKFMQVIAGLGYENTLGEIKNLLNSLDGGLRAKTAERLMAVESRRFVNLILPLIKHLVLYPFQDRNTVDFEVLILGFDVKTNEPSDRDNRQMDELSSNEGFANLLLEILTGGDRWMRIGALIALSASAKHHLSSSLFILDDGYFQNEPDPLVQQVAAQILSPSPSLAAEDLLIQRLLFLKNVSFLEKLTLDELLAVEKNLQKQEFLAGETIFDETSPKNDFYILYQGRILVRNRISLSAAGESQWATMRLKPGQYLSNPTNGELPTTVAIASNNCIVLILKYQDWQNLGIGILPQ